MLQTNFFAKVSKNKTFSNKYRIFEKQKLLKKIKVIKQLAYYRY